MSKPQQLRALVKERLTAAAEEIIQLYESAIEKYEEEASSSKHEIDRLRGLLQEFSDQKELSPLSIFQEESPPEQRQCEQESSLDQRDPEPRPIKEEDPEAWAEQVGEFKDVKQKYLPHTAVWEGHEQQDTKPCVEPQTQNAESEDQLQETKMVHFVLPFTSSPASQTRIRIEKIQGGRGFETPAASFMSTPTKMAQNQGSDSTSGESSESSHLNSAAPANHQLLNPTSTVAEILNVHCRSRQGSKCCPVCGKHFKTAATLAEHMTIHTGLKPHRCHVCGKECSRKGDLRIHMRIHTGEKPFCCSTCSKRFTNSGHLKKHVRSHTGERPHRCNVCGKGYLQSGHLKYHLGTHT